MLVHPTVTCRQITLMTMARTCQRDEDEDDDDDESEEETTTNIVMVSQFYFRYTVVRITAFHEA